MGAEPAARPMPRVIGPDAGRLLPAVLHRVIDGDSVELFVEGAVVRYELAGADAPDILFVGGEAEGVAFLRGSDEARGYLKTLLDGEQLAVLVDPRRGTDARGFRRGYVYRMPDGLFVNLEMVRLGFSKHARDPSGFNDAVMLWAQDRARAARKGVWSPVPVEVQQIEPVVEPAGKTVVDESESVDSVVIESDLALAVDSMVVYVTESGSKYHTKKCQHARDSGIARRLDEVESTHQACKVCKPGVGRDVRYAFENTPKVDRYFAHTQ
ncbi:MAG: thermonuclease family protein [Phycisphaerales bacterium]|nr:thermonuclease family protein [Phycisphaerales bacterium]